MEQTKAGSSQRSFQILGEEMDAADPQPSVLFTHIDTPQCLPTS